VVFQSDAVPDIPAGAGCPATVTVETPPKTLRARSYSDDAPGTNGVPSCRADSSECSASLHLAIAADIRGQYPDADCGRNIEGKDVVFFCPPERLPEGCR
jgi:hypothetical protein